jgi:hypothetical protein
MAANGPPMIFPPDGPPPMVAPQLPHSADLGTITGWILDETVAKMPKDITQELEWGFNHLVKKIPDQTHVNYKSVMQKMMDE